MITEDFDLIIKDFEDKCLNTVDVFKQEIQGVNTGRASPSMLDAIMVKAYGAIYKISELATVSILDSQTLSVKVWDGSTVSNVEKALMISDLEINPIREGDLLRIPITPMTQEKRLKIVKMIQIKSEEFKISIRNSRKTVNDIFKKSQKNIAKDEYNNYLKQIDEVTKKHISTIDDFVKKKEQLVLKL